METVVAFNTELSGLYDSKPPISKAKMAAITRGAMKAIKFYKHVVQSVEKFILKCKPEYKIPGLYVIDSIVRQSRHQFGAEKDVFAPRFARNMKQTFANLFRCAPEDKSRIIRVLNLWQKNSVFAPEVIQPLFDLADPNNPIYQMPAGQGGVQDLSNGMNTSGDSGTPNMDDSHGLSVDLTAASGHQTANTLDQSTIRQLQQLQQILIRQTNEAAASSVGGGSTGGINQSQSDSVKFNKKLLDYDYGDDEEEDKTTSPHVPNLLDGNNLSQLLKDPNVLRQLQTLQKLKQQEEKQSKLNEMRIQEEAFEKHLQNVLKGNSGVQSSTDGGEKEVEFIANDGSKIEVINLDGNDSRSPTPDRDRYNKRRRSSRSRSPRDRGRDRRRRSTSRSRIGGSRSPKSNRRRNSRERDRNKEKERDKEKEKEREYERERRRKGLPDIKKEHLSVCSTTLWVGHLSKLVQQEELSDTFGKYGDIVSIDMIHPRGCAFIVMNRRQDAHKAMGSLKNFKMQGRAITISWAAGKGVKSKEWKDYWDLDLGVSYIPWNRLSFDTDLQNLEEGGMFDEDSMPDWMKMKSNQKKDNTDKILGGGIFGMDGLANVDTTQPPPTTGAMMSGVPMVPPFPMGPVPRLMPPMGVPMPGMVPGIGMPPNMVPPGMPPPHMMMPSGGMVPGFGPMPPHMDKSVPPPNPGPSENPSMPPPFMGNLHMPPMQHQPPFGNMGMPPQFNPQQQQHQQPNPVMPPPDDHMDIEMEDENPMNAIKPPPAMNFNQPPPMFQPNFNMNEMPGGMGSDNRKNDRDDGRDNSNRNDFPNQRERGSRWGNERSASRDRDMQSRDRNDNMNDGRPDFNRRPPPLDQINEMPGQIWRDNGPNFQPPPNFGNDNGRRGVVGGPNLPMDMQNAPPPHLRPPHEFFDGRRDDFGMDERRGGGGGGGGQQRDFFPNPGNRFGPQPGQGMPRGSPMPMRGGPPQPPFGPRLGPMFLRGPSRPGPPAGFNYGNDRPPFERDERGGGGGGGGNGVGNNRMRGGNNSMDRRGGQGNWRDDEDGPGPAPGGVGRRGNRFQNRDRDGDRDEPKNRDRSDRDRGDRDRGDRDRGGGDRDRGDRDRGDRDRGRNDRDRKLERKTTPPAPTGHLRNEIDFKDTEEDWDKELIDRKKTPPPPPVANRRENLPAKKSQSFGDTEEDWDNELSEHKLDDKIPDASPTRKQNPFAATTNLSPAYSDDFPIARNPSPPPSFEQDKEIFNEPEPPSQQPNKSHQSNDNVSEDIFAMPEEPATTTSAPKKKTHEEQPQPVACVNTTPLYDEPGESGSEKTATSQS